MIQAAIFDMDGLLIDSEPYWKEAERRVFGSLGVAVTSETQKLTGALAPRAVTEYWYSLHPWPDKSFDEVESDVVSMVAGMIAAEGNAKSGVHETLNRCRTAGMKIGLASNSPVSLCLQVLEKLRIREDFDSIASAEAVARGKPAPDVYYHAARLLGAAPERCLAFEDSLTGARAAKTAGMTVVLVPSEADRGRRPVPEADLVLASLSELTPRCLSLLLTGRPSARLDNPKGRLNKGYP